MKRKTQTKNEFTCLSNEELMILYKNSHYIAFEILYERHSSRIYQYLKTKLDEQTALEVLQDSFARLHKARSTYNKNYPFLPWMFTIVRNLVLDHYKKAETKTQKKIISNDLESLAKTEPNPNYDQTESLKKILANLPVKQQEILLKRYLKGWSFEKIAQDIETSPSNARKIISRSLQKLRTQFKKLQEDL